MMKYIKIIAEGGFKKYDYHAIQSRITLNFDTHKLAGKPLTTGNLVLKVNKNQIQVKNLIV